MKPFIMGLPIFVFFFMLGLLSPTDGPLLYSPPVAVQTFIVDNQFYIKVTALISGVISCLVMAYAFVESCQLMQDGFKDDSGPKDSKPNF
jgi:hypothetical protein